MLPFAACVKPSGDDPLHTDNSFELDVYASYAEDYLRNSVHVSLKEGIEGEYTCALLIDGEKVSGTEILDRGSFTSGDAVDLKKSSEQVFILPETSTGAHVATFTFTREGITRTVDVEYVRENPVTARSEIYEDCCQVIIESSGLVGSCTVSLYIDGENVSEIIRDGTEVSCPISADFRKSPYMVLTFPSDLNSGSHVVTIVVSTAKGTYETSVSFYRDYTSVISITSLYRADQLCNAVQVKLDEGIERPYTVEYLIDDDPTLKIRTSTGSSVDSGFGVTLSKNKPVLYFLPRLSAGVHTATFRFTSESVTSEYNVRFEEFPPFSTEVLDVDTSTPRLVIRADERVTGVFSMEFLLNGKEYGKLTRNGVTVGSPCSFDFTTQKEVEFMFPEMELGEYNVSVTLSNGSGATDTVDEYFNITRDYVLKLNLSLDKVDNRVYYTYSSPNNMFKESIRMKIRYTIRGRLKWIHETWVNTNSSDICTMDYEDIIETETVTITPASYKMRLPIDTLQILLKNMHQSHKAVHQWRNASFETVSAFVKSKVDMHTYINHVAMEFMFFDEDDNQYDKPVVITFEDFGNNGDNHYIPFHYDYITWFTWNPEGKPLPANEDEYPAAEKNTHRNSKYYTTNSSHPVDVEILPICSIYNPVSRQKALESSYIRDGKEYMLNL